MKNKITQIALVATLFFALSISVVSAAKGTNPLDLVWAAIHDLEQQSDQNEARFFPL